MKQRTQAVEVRRQGERGFSLIEMLVVLAIMALILGIVAPRVMHYFSESKTKAARIQVNYIKTALDLFLLDVGRYPTEEEGLKVLVANDSHIENWNGPYLKKKAVPEDPWGHAYHYRLNGNGQEPEVYSLGADNEQGGDGQNSDVGLAEDSQAPPPSS